MTEYWWRSWHGAPMDAKWAAIARRAGVEPIIVSAIAWAVMDYASQQQDRGSIAEFDTESYSVWAGIDEQKVIAVIQAMTDKGIIADGRLANWDKRQPKSDKKIEQVTEWRKNKKTVTECYQVLPEITPDTDTDTDTDTEKDKEKKEEDLPPRPEIFTLYESEIGHLTPAISDKLLAAEKDYPITYIIDALKEAATNNKRSWAYTEAILKRWKVEGRGNGKTNGKPKRTRTLTDAYGNTIEEEY